MSAQGKKRLALQNFGEAVLDLIAETDTDIDVQDVYDAGVENGVLKYIEEHNYYAVDV